MAETKGLTGATLGVTQTVALWTVLMPPVHEVKHHTPGSDPAFANDVRHTELVVSAVSLAIAVVMSRLERSWMPLVASSTLLFTLVVAYEYTLRRPGYSASGERPSNVRPIRQDA